MKQYLLYVLGLFVLYSCSTDDEKYVEKLSYASISKQRNTLAKMSSITGEWKFYFTSMGNPINENSFLKINSDNLYLKTDKYDFSSSDFQSIDDGAIIVKNNNEEFKIFIAEPTLHTPYYLVYITRGNSLPDTFFAEKK
ncbi:hypothetical protein CLU97_0121 [Chryseobacterium sp. 7]|uniref:hypothetical protein n=1 Tax=Chryseobacterium sp. 7 TaxID=2035214 RepID=UPI000EB2F104|nr:hypothetical protein [Chryseobacterium sp. 7]RLJ30731.1 hypothetical protein CLU97_0121 [Chryseobacterium sp. 7]